MVPRQISETLRPVRPSRRVCMFAPFAGMDPPQPLYGHVGQAFSLPVTLPRTPDFSDKRRTIPRCAVVFCCASPFLSLFSSSLNLNCVTNSRTGGRTMSWAMVMMMALAGGDEPVDLVKVVPAEAYFKAKNVPINLDNM